MSQMIAQPDDGPIREFRCTQCDWVFCVQQPVTDEVSLELQHRYAERWFAAHHCRAAKPHGSDFDKRSYNSTSAAVRA